MSVRFDEVELLREPELPSPESLVASVPIVLDTPPLQPAAPPRPAVRETPQAKPASRFHRALALLTDVSLFIALALSLTPLFPYRSEWGTVLRNDWPSVFALSAFLLLLTYYYFVTSWLIWGKTVGGAIFDIRVVPEQGEVMTARNLSRRWAGMFLSVLLCGLGFLPALLPRGRSLADRLSGTRTVTA